MDYIHAIILGIIQGLTEFLPVSSSAHLLILPKIMDWRNFGLAFDVALHAGTTISLLIYFARDIRDILSAMLRWDNSPRGRQLRHLGWAVGISCIPAGIVGLTLQKEIETVFRSPLISGINLIVFGIILYLADHRCSQRRSMDEITFKDAILIGIFQALALIPGVSRSGITITGGLFKGFRRDEAARFSFLMISPLVLGATILEAIELHAKLTAAGQWQQYLSNGLPVLIVGTLVSLVIGVLCIKYFLHFLKKFPLDVFVLYRLILGIAVILLFI